MEHVKKMILVPSETVARLQEKPVIPTPTDKINELDQEMNRVLQQHGDQTEKLREYEKLLQRCMHFVNEQRKPFRLTLPDGKEDEPSEPDPTQQLRRQLETAASKSLKNHALGLYDQLKLTPGILWDRTGTLTIAGNRYPDCNIIDIVFDAAKQRRSGCANNWRVFAQHLAKSNFPIEFIRNTAYKKFIRDQRGHGLTSHHGPSQNHSKKRKREPSVIPSGVNWKAWR